MTEAHKHISMQTVEHLEQVMSAKLAADIRYDEAFKMVKLALDIPGEWDIGIDFATGEVVAKEPPHSKPPDHAAVTTASAALKKEASDG